MRNLFFQLEDIIVFNANHSELATQIIRVCDSTPVGYYSHTQSEFVTYEGEFFTGVILAEGQYWHLKNGGVVSTSPNRNPRHDIHIVCLNT